MLTRRSFLKRLAAVGLVVAAPAIVPEEVRQRFFALDGGMVRDEPIGFNLYGTAVVEFRTGGGENNGPLPFIPEIWSDGVLKATRWNAVLANRLADRFDALDWNEPGITLSVPQLSALRKASKVVKDGIQLQDAPDGGGRVGTFEGVPIYVPHHWQDGEKVYGPPIDNLLGAGKHKAGDPITWKSVPPTQVRPFYDGDGLCGVERLDTPGRTDRERVG